MTRVTKRKRLSPTSKRLFGASGSRGRWATMFITVGFVVGCREDRVEIAVPKGYDGPVVVVDEAPGGVRRTRTIQVPSSGIVFLDRFLGPAFRVVEQGQSGRGNSPRPARYQNRWASNECGCYSHLSFYHGKDSPSVASAKLGAAEKRAEEEWMRRRRKANQCTPPPTPSYCNEQVAKRLEQK